MVLASPIQCLVVKKRASKLLVKACPFTGLDEYHRTGQQTTPPIELNQDLVKHGGFDE